MPPNDQDQISDIRKDMIATFATESGEKVFAWLIRQCKFDSTLMVFDPYEALFYEGKRSVIVDMLNVMQDPRLKDRQRALSSMEPPLYEVTEPGDTD